MIAIRKKIINHCMGVVLNNMTRASGFYLLVIIVTLMLSVWQVQRGWTAFDHQKTQNIKENDIIQGYWLAERVLLDNRTLQGAAGYWVFAPFLLLNKEVRWVRLGFYPTQNRDHIILPAVPEKTLATIEVTTIPWITPLMWRGDNLESLNDFTWRFQQLSLQALTQLSKKIWTSTQASNVSQIELYALVDIPEGFKRPGASKPYLQPYTHFGYAFQWFGLAVVASIFMVKFMSKKRLSHDSAKS